MYTTVMYIQIYVPIHIYLYTYIYIYTHTHTRMYLETKLRVQVSSSELPVTRFRAWEIRGAEDTQKGARAGDMNRAFRCFLGV